MRLALSLASNGRASSQPNPMVGAVIVADGEIVGEGFHECAGGDHAEIKAIATAGERTKGSTLFVTLEPCCIYGKTPPCTDAIIAAGISHVICSQKDPNPMVNGKGLDILRDTGISVEEGLLGGESSKLNEVYTKYIRFGVPFVTLKLAQSLDGNIMTPPDLKWVTGELARRLVHEMRASNKAVMVGIGTVETDDPHLNVRYGEYASSAAQPLRVVVDTQLRITTGTTLTRTAREQPTTVYTGPGPDETKTKELSEAGIDVVMAPAEPGGRLDLKWILEDLGRKEISSVMVEGGRRLATSFVNRRLIDKLVLFLAPRIVGEGGGLEGVKQGFELGDISVDIIGSDVLIVGYPAQAGV